MNRALFERSIAYDLLWIVLAAVALGPLASAQDQTVIISKPPRLCAPGVPTTTDLSETQAADLIRQVLDPTIDPTRYYIIHVVRYNDDQFTIERQNWYVYYQGWAGSHSLWQELSDTDIAKHFKQTRIFGSSNVALIYLHQNVPAVAESTALNAAIAARRVQLTSTAAPPESPVARSKAIDSLRALDPTNPLLSPTATSVPLLEIRAEVDVRQTLREMHDSTPGSLTLVDQSTRRTLALVAGPGNSLGVLIDSAFKDLASLSYKIAITKKIPAPIQNLQGIAGIISGHGDEKAIPVPLQPSMLCGGQAFGVAPLPSDMVVSALAGKDQKELSKNTYDNEKKYRYDFSFALPLKSYNDLSVNSSDLTLTAKKVDKQNLFAVVNLSPWPFDTKKPQLRLLPVFLYGLPISGKPLNHHLVAGAIGLNRVQFFAGVMLNHNHTLTGAAQPSSTASSLATAPGPVQDRWGTKLTYGINFSVTTITGLLKGSKK